MARDGWGHAVIRFFGPDQSPERAVELLADLRPGDSLVVPDRGPVFDAVCAAIHAGPFNGHFNRNTLVVSHAYGRGSAHSI